MIATCTAAVCWTLMVLTGSPTGDAQFKVGVYGSEQACREAFDSHRPRSPSFAKSASCNGSDGRTVSIFPVQ